VCNERERERKRERERARERESERARERVTYLATEVVIGDEVLVGQFLVGER
jgi:hypothetical protein